MRPASLAGHLWAHWCRTSGLFFLKGWDSQGVKAQPGLFGVHLGRLSQPGSRDSTMKVGGISNWISTDSVLIQYWKLLKVTGYSFSVFLRYLWNCVISKVSWWVPVRTNGCCEDMCISPSLWRWHGSQQPALKPGLYGQNLVYGAEFQQGASQKLWRNLDWDRDLFGWISDIE